MENKIMPNREKLESFLKSYLNEYTNLPKYVYTKEYAKAVIEYVCQHWLKGPMIIEQNVIDRLYNDMLCALLISEELQETPFKFDFDRTNK